MKKILSMLLALCMVISMLPVAAFAASDPFTEGFMATAEADSKYQYAYSPATKGTLTITVGDGSTNWSSDVMYFDSNFAMQTAGSASGCEQATYTAEIDPEISGTYRIRVWETNGGSLTDTPLYVTWKSEDGSTGVTVEGEVLSGYVVTDGVAGKELVPMKGSDVELAGGDNPESINYAFSPETDGILTVHIISGSTGWWYSGENLCGQETGTGESAHTYEVRAGTDYTVDLGCYEDWANAGGTISYEILFYAQELEAVKEPFIFSETVIEEPGEYAVTVEENSDATVVTLTPAEVGVYTITVEGGTIADLGNNATLVDLFLDNEYGTSLEWTCKEVAGIETDIIWDENYNEIEITRETEGQSLYIGVKSEAETVTISVEKTGDYEVEVVELQTYMNKKFPTKFEIPEGYVVGDYVDVTEAHSAVLGEDGYYHLDSADGDILLVDMDYRFRLSEALEGGRCVMYAYVTDENGVILEKWDIGNAVRLYENNCDENKYYPLTQDLIFFYDTYARGNGVYAYALEGINYNEGTAWMYACLTMSNPAEEDLTTGSIEIGEWTAPLTGTVTISTDAEGAFAFVDVDNDYAVQEFEGSITVDVTAGSIYILDAMSGQTGSFTYTYAAQGGDEGGDAEITYSGLIIGNNNINGEDAHWSYTAASAGTLTLEAGNAIGTVTYSYTINDGAAQSDLVSGSSVALTLAQGDVVKLDASASGAYATVTASWSGESSGGEGGETSAALVLGDNEVSVAAGLTPGSWTYTASEAGTLNISVTALSIAGEAVDEAYLANLFSMGQVILTVNGTPLASNTGSVAVAVGDAVAFEMSHRTYSALDATINLAMAEGGEGGDVEDPNAGYAGSGSTSDPYIIESLAEPVTLNISDDTYFKYIVEKNGTIEISEINLGDGYSSNGGGILTKVNDASWANDVSYEVVAGNVVIFNPYYIGSCVVSLIADEDEEITGSGTMIDPYVITKLPYNGAYAAGSDVYYTYIAEQSGDIMVTMPEDVMIDFASASSTNNGDGTVTYICYLNEGDELNLHPYNGATDGIFKVEVSDGSDVPAEPDGSMNNPYILDDLYGTLDVKIAEDRGYTYYQYTATEGGSVAASSDDVNTYFVVNDNWVYGSTEFAAGDVILIEFGTSDVAGTYSVELFDPTVAKIGDVAYTSVEEALEAAVSGDVVTLVADAVADGYVVIPVGVSIDLAGYSLTADYVYGSKGSSISAKANEGKLIVPEGNLILGQGVTNQGYTILPVWAPEENAYKFAKFMVYTDSNMRNLRVMESEGKLEFQFTHVASTSIDDSLLADNGCSDNKLSVIVRLEWVNEDGTAYQNFVFNDGFVKTVAAAGNRDYILRLNGMDALEINLDTLKVYGMITSESGAICYGNEFFAN